MHSYGEAGNTVCVTPALLRKVIQQLVARYAVRPQPKLGDGYGACVPAENVEPPELLLRRPITNCERKRRTAIQPANLVTPVSSKVMAATSLIVTKSMIVHLVHMRGIKMPLHL